MVPLLLATTQPLPPRRHARSHLDRPCVTFLIRYNSSFWFSINPTYTYVDAPSDIEVLLIPGGAESTFLNITSTINFIKERYPKLKYLITICTGAGVAARAGVLSSKRATNKKAWNVTTAFGPNVDWKSPARWTVHGNIRTSSGVTAGLDLIFAFIGEMYGEDFPKDLQGTIEYEARTDMCDDPFAEINKMQPTWDCVEEMG